MSSHIFPNIFTSEQLEYIFTLPEVIEARQKVENVSNSVKFDIELREDIKETLKKRFTIDISSLSRIPMRWIKGDTPSHIDKGISDFKYTYLVYLNDNPGELIFDNKSYPITKNTGFAFKEGLPHETRNTGTEPRLLIGPMSETGFVVGASNTYYYPTEIDALNNTNYLGYRSENAPTPFIVGELTFGDIGSFTSWRIAPNSQGVASQLIVYNNGSTLINEGGDYYLYPNIPCFLEGTKILCLIDNKEIYIPIENIRKGTLVKTSRDGLKKVEFIGKGTINNSGTDERTENRLYKCSKNVYSELNEDLIITGCHSLLVNEITEKQRAKIIESLGGIYVTDRKYRLMAYIDEKAQPWISEGTYTIWHFALEHNDEAMNYGVYANGGLLVETCSLRFIRNKSNMILI